MRPSIYGSCYNSLKCCVFLCVTLIGAQVAPAGAGENPKPESFSLHEVHKIQTPMSGKSAAVAPYSVRMRITGFLARQHAREGNIQRALTEYHSMLNVDDPGWPDNEQGDSMRIARDIDVAQMMSESGFYDHAIRVLQTSLILARVDQDPQAAVVERQMLATVQLAQVKGVAVPLIDLTYAQSEELIAQFRAEQQAVAAASPQRSPVVADSAQPEMQVASGPTSHVYMHHSPAEHPSASIYPDAQATAPKSEQTEKRSADRSRLGRLIPSRWRNKKDAGLEVASKPTAIQQRPLVSPDVSATYCGECAGLHAQPSPHAGIATSPSARSSVAHLSDPFRSTAQRQTTGVSRPMPELESLPQDSTVSSKSKMASSQPSSGFAIEEDIWAKPSAKDSPLREVPAAGRSSDPKYVPQEQVKSGHEVSLTAHQAESQQRMATEAISESENKDSGPGPQLQRASETASDESVQEPPAQMSAPKQRRQVGVAGQISSPGIFAIEGTSTTLAALLRRTGGQALGTDAQTRIVRSVDLGSATDSAENSKDFYCQRLEVVYPSGKELDTPIYGQEVVIVDSPGQNPIYVAIMPHFILQLPAKASNPITADQIVEQLRVFWPNMRDCETGVVRFDQWGRAAKVARLQEANSSVESPLQAGDVLYVDGVGLDRSQVLSAAESIARLGGAKIRKAESDVQQTKATAE